MLANYVVNVFRMSSLRSCRLAGSGGGGSCFWKKIEISIVATDTTLLGGIRHAGHSKWQNIRHTKAAKDLQKNQLYNKHIDLMKLAIREGKSTNPKNNVRLASCIEAAKKEGVAVTTLNNVLQKMEKALLNPRPVTYEYRGSNGVLVIINANTDNKNRTRADINYVTKRHGLVRAENITSAFDHKGFVYAKPPADAENADEKALEDAIEVGAEEVQRDEANPDILVFKCDGVECSAIRSKLEGRQYRIEDSEELFVARTVVELEENESKIYYEAFEKLDELPEVSGIYTNLA